MKKPGSEGEGLIHFAPEEAVTQKGVERDVDVVVDPEVNQIEKVGERSDVREWVEAQKKLGRPFGKEVVGGAVMPGLTDAHEHPMLFAALENVIKPVFVYGMDREQAVEAIKRAAADGGDLPVIAMGFNATITNFGQDELRQIVGNRKAAIFDPSFHGALVTPAMAEAVKKLMTDPQTPGHISADGHATEEYALATLQVAEAYHSIEGMTEAVGSKLEHHLTQGITALHDLSPNTMSELIAGLQARKNWGEKHGTEFPITRFHLRPAILKEVGERLGELERSGLLTAEEFPELFSLKLLADGSLGSYTAKMKEPFLGEKGRGIWFHNLEQINDALTMARKYGIDHVAMHAIGDEAVDRALDTALQWRRMADKEGFDPKFRIEHFELPLPTDKTLERTHDLGVWVCPQPNFLLDYVYKDRLGERVRWICPHSAILKAKIPMMFGTDGAAGATDSMLYAMYLATHATEGHQRLGFHEAFLASAFTAADYEHDNRGALRQGYKGDIIVADPSLLAKLATGEPDVNQATMAKTIAELEGTIRRVYKSGTEVYRRLEKP